MRHHAGEILFIINACYLTDQMKNLCIDWGVGEYMTKQSSRKNTDHTEGVGWSVITTSQSWAHSAKNTAACSSVVNTNSLRSLLEWLVVMLQHSSDLAHLHHLVSYISLTAPWFIIMWRPGGLYTLLILLADVIVWPIGPVTIFFCQPTILDCFDN